jgi:hypothetical protein
VTQTGQFFCGQIVGLCEVHIAGLFLAGEVTFLRLLLGVQVAGIAEPLVEAVHHRQDFVAIAEAILAELQRSATLRLEHFDRVGSLSWMSRVVPGMSMVVKEVRTLAP